MSVLKLNFIANTALVKRADDTASEINWNKALLNQINRWDVYQTNESGDLDISSVFESMKPNYQQTLTTNYKVSITYTRAIVLNISQQGFKTKCFHIIISVSKNILITAKRLSLLGIGI